VNVPNVCFQGDLGNVQGDLGAFQADLVLQNLGLIGIPILITSSNIVAGFLLGGECKKPPCCIRMTGGGGTILTLGGISVETSEGFQLRTDPDSHSNLEVHWTTPDGVAHNFHLGPPDGVSNFTCASTPCPGGGGGGKPQDQPNTILGTAIGTLDGQPGATILINFVDCGEPGTNDTRQIAIYDSNMVPQLVASGTIQNGNNQAHKC